MLYKKGFHRTLCIYVKNYLMIQEHAEPFLVPKTWSDHFLYDLISLSHHCERILVKPSGLCLYTALFSPVTAFQSGWGLDFEWCVAVNKKSLIRSLWVLLTLFITMELLRGHLVFHGISQSPVKMLFFTWLYVSVQTIWLTLKITSHLHFLIWLPVSDGLCSTAGMKPVLFGENSTSGCLLPVSRQNLTQCSLLRSVALHDYFSNVYM